MRISTSAILRFFLLIVAFSSSLSAVKANAILQLDTSITNLDPTLACGLNSQVRLLAGQANTYQWVRNGTAIPGATSRQFAASISGSYRVRVSDVLGNSDSSRAIDILIVPNPVAGFSVNQLSQCFFGNRFTFTNSSTVSQGTLTYTWYYGDGTFQISTSGAHSYAGPGMYSVKLVATSNYGCVDSSRVNVTVSSNPVVSFSVNNVSQCQNNNYFSFANTSNNGSFPLVYRWSFGDGGSSTALNPNYQYSQSGNYNVKLVATSSLGCSDSTAVAVSVHPKPNVVLTVNNNQQCLTGNFFQFVNQTSISQGSVSYRWDFGNGISSGLLSPGISYTNAGFYLVKMIATSDRGCLDSSAIDLRVDPSPVAQFSVNRTVDCFNGHQFQFTDRSILSSGAYQNMWDFGDGAGFSTLTNPQYSYQQPGTYRVSLTVTSNNSCSSVFTTNIFLNPSPSGNIIAPSDTVICEGGVVQLRSTSAQSYQWLFNSIPIAGANSMILNATEAGRYTVRIINSFNCSALSGNAVTLTKVIQPIADFTFDHSCVNSPITFSNTSSVLSSMPVVYRWKIGDTIFNNITNLAYTFRTPGTYSVQLSVIPTSCPQLTRTAIKSITVETSPPPIRYVSVNAVSGKDVMIRAREFSRATYFWSPATGLSSISVFNPVFNHTTPQEYLVQITTQSGCKVTDSVSIRMFSEKKIYLPDYFTPNGDGKNDKISPFLVGIQRLTHFSIWNRWGQLMFKTNTAENGWDGSFQGVKQPMETYLWIAEGLDIDGKIFRSSGSFVLVK